MDWFRQINNYCERMDGAYWAEPVNALTNLSFIFAALVCLKMISGRRDPGARLLIGILAAIGVGSFLFHTHAQLWSILADVLPIQAFILVYIYLATTRFFSAPVWVAALAAAAFIPIAAVLVRQLAEVFGDLNGSMGYVPVPILIAAYAVALHRRARPTARRLAIGAAILVVSLFFRTVDEAICVAIPLGTHFLWHILNGVMLGWMIATLVRHEEPALAAGRMRR